MATTLDVQQTPLTAIVHAADGVRFVAVAQNPTALAAKVAGYICERCDFALWPPVAAKVRAAIDHGDPRSAIALYFAHVGDRWDDEHLELGGVAPWSASAALHAAPT